MWATSLYLESGPFSLTRYKLVGIRSRYVTSEITTCLPMLAVEIYKAFDLRCKFDIIAMDHGSL